MKNLKNIIAVAALSLVGVNAMAQNTESAYFAEGNLYRHDINPAIGNENGYLAMPIVLSNMNVRVAGNIGLSDLLYNRGGKTVTFMHQDVSKADFLKNIKERCELNQDLKYQLLGAGFKGFNGYNTIEINLREMVGVSVPGSLLELAKKGLENGRYNLNNLDAYGTAYAEVALGHSHQINDNLRIGAKLKVLVGAGNFDANIKDAYLDIDETRGITAKADGEIHGNVSGLQIKSNSDGYFDELDIDGAGVGGFGIAVDLGAEYKINDNWKVSASVLDLGFISWNTNKVLKIDNTVCSNDYVYDVDKEKYYNTSTGEEIEDAFDAFNLAEDATAATSRTKALGATINAGAEFKAPFYDKLSFGLLNTTRIQGDWSWTDFRLSANVAPIKAFSASANLHAGTYGVGFGWLLDLHPKGFGLYIAMDHMLGKLAKQGVPLSPNAEFSMGINFPF